MKNEVAVLVLLYFGVASEFILPLGGVEIGLKNNTSRKEKIVATAASQSTAHTVELPKENSVIEKDLYEYGEPKKNQSERAFIYIQKMFMKPFSQQHLKHKEKPLKFDPERSIPNVPPNLKPKCDCKPKSPNSYFKDHHRHLEVAETKSYLALLKKDNDIPKVREYKMIQDNIHMASQVAPENQNNVVIPGSLIFSPLYASENDDMILNQNMPYDLYADMEKLRHIRKSIDSKTKTFKQGPKNKIRETFGYNSHHGRDPNSEFNEQTNNFGDSLNLQDLLAGDFDAEKSDYDDKIVLDKYLKEDIEEESKSNDTVRHENAEDESNAQPKEEVTEFVKSAKCKCV